jgi:hypothetical protein
VIGLDGERDRTRSECRTSKAPHRVLPVIKTLENQDFPGFPAAFLITLRRWPEIRPCDRSHTEHLERTPENSAQSEQRRVSAT